ncbi:hypothetical protein BT69DRAFT_1301251 [Atractiella rhizophila]|nr:hypothetical protein BT69DRAFT_1301251 [Atractiella rhizophila]
MAQLDDEINMIELSVTVGVMKLFSDDRYWALIEKAYHCVQTVIVWLHCYVLSIAQSLGTNKTWPATDHNRPEIAKLLSHHCLTIVEPLRQLSALVNNRSMFASLCRKEWTCQSLTTPSETIDTAPNDAIMMQGISLATSKMVEQRDISAHNPWSTPLQL